MRPAGCWFIERVLFRFYPRPGGGVAALCCLMLAGCGFDLTYPFRNDPPRIARDGVVQGTDPPAIIRTLNYPDSAVCTLTVTDSNDSTLDCSGEGWPGRCTLVEGGLASKRFVVYLSSPVLGEHFRGFWRVADPDGGADSVWYEIRRHFLLRMNRRAQLDEFWEPYEPAMREGPFPLIDTLSREFETGMLYLFRKETVPFRTTAGIRSRFRLTGDFSVSIWFRFQETVRDGFETAFFVSTSADPLPYDGDEAGIYISSEGNTFVVTANSMGDASSVTRPRGYYYGKLMITRTDDRVRMFQQYWDIHHETLDTLTFPLAYTDDTVFTHIRMVAADSLHDRWCLWSNFFIEKGTLVTDE